MGKGQIDQKKEPSKSKLTAGADYLRGYAKLTPDSDFHIDAVKPAA